MAEKFQSFEDLAKLLPESERSVKPPIPLKKGHDGKGRTVRVLLDTKGRKGKTVTLVRGLQHNPDTMEEIAKILKQYCGAGGTVKDGDIEIQGDQRSRVSEKMRALNYEVRG
jgi:predicted translation initiation factor SUI1